MKEAAVGMVIAVFFAATFIFIGAYYATPASQAQSPFDCDPIYEDAERADTPAERQALAQLYIACMVRENWR